MVVGGKEQEGRWMDMGGESRVLSGQSWGGGRLTISIFSSSDHLLLLCETPVLPCGILKVIFFVLLSPETTWERPSSSPGIPASPGSHRSPLPPAGNVQYLLWGKWEGPDTTFSGEAEIMGPGS